VGRNERCPTRNGKKSSRELNSFLSFFKRFSERERPVFIGFGEPSYDYAVSQVDVAPRQNTPLRDASRKKTAHR
jgi:hypothetical protein